MASYQFPESFAWGAATAAYQIEGAVQEDGRKPSVWDVFSRRLRWHTLNRDTGDVACDHYHRYQDDVKLMVQLGIKHYRFSVSWCRIVPDGRGAVNEAGVDFYRRLVDCLLEHGITPYVTLFHWDSPQALEDRYGSWRSREMAKDFADYAEVVVKRLGDRVTRWITLNEIVCFTHMSYGKFPMHAPGKRLQNEQEVWQTSHHALLAHGLACQAIRAASPTPCAVAIVDNPAIPVPISESAENIAAARAAFSRLGINGGAIVPVLTGAYSPQFLTDLGADAPTIEADDLATIHQPLDWFGLNVYSGSYVRAADNDKGFELVPFPKGYPRLHMPWLWVVPESLYWGVCHVNDTLGQVALPIVVTENGCAVKDRLNKANEIADADRIFYLRHHLHAAHRAVSEGYPLQGYFVWSLLDNFEWAWGYSRRFGITYIDYPSQQRIPKASFHWYSECIRQNRVV